MSITNFQNYGFIVFIYNIDVLISFNIIEIFLPEVTFITKVPTFNVKTISGTNIRLYL